MKVAAEVAAINAPEAAEMVEVALCTLVGFVFDLSLTRALGRGAPNLFACAHRI